MLGFRKKLMLPKIGAKLAAELRVAQQGVAVVTCKEETSTKTIVAIVKESPQQKFRDGDYRVMQLAVIRKRRMRSSKAVVGVEQARVRERVAPPVYHLPHLSGYHLHLLPIWYHLPISYFKHM